MGWHIHKKDGKYNIWSTIVDDYILTEWTDEETVKKLYIKGRMAEAKKQIIEDIEELLTHVEKDGFCSAPYEPGRCSPEIVKQNLALKHKDEYGKIKPGGPT